MVTRIDAETFATMYDVFMDADTSNLEVHLGSPRENYIDTNTRAKMYRKALTSLGLRKYVSVRSSKYGWVDINSDQPDWEMFSEASYEDVQDMSADISDKLEAIWQTIFPEIRNIREPQIDYFSMSYSIN